MMALSVAQITELFHIAFLDVLSRRLDPADAILTSPPIATLLRPSGLAIAEFSKPKQTATTRRWKVGLEAPEHPRPVRTKIEFSARNGDQRFRLDAIPATIVASYALRAPTVQHYAEEAACEQKVKALAGRSETQARDVFDLDLLLRRRSLPTGALDADLLSEAAARALELPFAAFRDQVLPFVEPEAAELYEGEATWEQMQTSVAERLEAAR